MVIFKERDTPRAKALRNGATEMEAKLWQQLKGRRINGVKFSRQIPIGPYFADFVSRERGLVIELDGPSHEMTSEGDAKRTTYLLSKGFRVVRFTNDDVRFNLDGVVRHIAQVLDPTPLAAQAAPPASGWGIERGATR